MTHKQLVARRLVDFVSVFATVDERLPQPLVDFLMETREHPALDYVVDSFARAAEAGLDVLDPELAAQLVEAGKERLRQANGQVHRERPFPEFAAVVRQTRLKSVKHDPSVQNLDVVYFMRLGDLIKIGYTTNLRQRVSSINPEEVLATEPGGRARERELHKRFAALRVHGEWFRHEGELAEYISTLREVRRDRTA